MLSDKASIDVRDYSIVLLGDFNPAIFHPLWFAQNDLIRSEEAEIAEVEFVSKTVTKFKTDWFSVLVQLDRMMVQTSDATKSLPLRDLVLGIFVILEHTPIRAIGFNCDTNYEVTDPELWKNSGHHLAPKQYWNAIVEEPGMLDLTIVGKRPGHEEGVVRFAVQPVKLRNGKTTGIMVAINQHYDLKKQPDDSSAAMVVDTLNKHWISFTDYAGQSGEQLINRCLEPLESV